MQPYIGKPEDEGVERNPEIVPSMPFEEVETNDFMDNV